MDVDTARANRTMQENWVNDAGNACDYDCKDFGKDDHFEGQCCMDSTSVIEGLAYCSESIKLKDDNIIDIIDTEEVTEKNGWTKASITNLVSSQDQETDKRNQRNAAEVVHLINMEWSQLLPILF